MLVKLLHGLGGKNPRVVKPRDVLEELLVALVSTLKLAEEVLVVDLLMNAVSFPRGHALWHVEGSTQNHQSKETVWCMLLLYVLEEVVASKREAHTDLGRIWVALMDKLDQLVCIAYRVQAEEPSTLERTHWVR